jgi:uncharacterized surface protein with fasciclin (FAS1) repeats
MIRKTIAGLAAGAALAAPLALAAPAQAAPTTIVDELLARSGGASAIGSFDSNGRDFDILIKLAVDAGLGGALGGLQGTLFAPADASFRGLVADLTNTAPWRLSEQQVFDAIDGLDDAIVAQVLTYHVTTESIPNLRKAPDTVDTLEGGDFGVRKGWIVSFSDDDHNDLNPFWIGQTIKAGNGGTVHVIAGVLRPIDLP